MEFAVGHGTATRAAVASGGCRTVATTWMPEAEVERVEPSAMNGVELGMEALAAVADAAILRARLAPIVTDYRDWIASATRASAHKRPARRSVGRPAAARVDGGWSDRGWPCIAGRSARLASVLLTNRTMAMAARQRRAQEQNIQPAAAEAPEWRPFQLAFLLMNLRAFVSPGARGPRDRRPAVLPDRRRQDRGVPGSGGIRHSPAPAARSAL